MKNNYYFIIRLNYLFNSVVKRYNGKQNEHETIFNPNFIHTNKY